MGRVIHLDLYIRGYIRIITHSRSQKSYLKTQESERYSY